MENNNNSSKKTKNIIAVLVASSVLLIVLTISYAFLPTDNLPNEPEEGSLSTAKLSLLYTDCASTNQNDCANITADLDPDDSVIKTFEITNTGTRDVEYDIVFKELISTFVNDELVYELKNLTTNEIVVSETPIKKGTFTNQTIYRKATATVGETTRYQLTITFLEKDYDQYENVGAEFSIKLGIEASKELLLDGILAKRNADTVTNYTDGNTKEMYAFSHDELTTETTSYSGTSTYTHSATQVAAWSSEERKDYRYIGNNPNNYIQFNDEAWRIIGVFTVETEDGSKEQLIKIIRDESIGDVPWDMMPNKKNEWSTSSLHGLLNGDYYNIGEEFTYTYVYGDYEKEITISKGLNETSRNQIANVKWYLGGSKTHNNLRGPDYYAFERGTTTCATTGNCNGETRTTSIMQRVGLMYASDYIYTYAYGVDNKCYTNGDYCQTSSGGTPSSGWLYKIAHYQWTLTTYASVGDIAFYVNYDNVNYDYVEYFNGIRPSVYLSSEIYISDGNGSKDSPYTIE